MLSAGSGLVLSAVRTATAVGAATRCTRVRCSCQLAVRGFAAVAATTLQLLAHTLVVPIASIVHRLSSFARGGGHSSALSRSGAGAFGVLHRAGDLCGRRRHLCLFGCRCGRVAEGCN